MNNSKLNFKDNSCKSDLDIVKSASHISHTLHSVHQETTPVKEDSKYLGACNNEGGTSECGFCFHSFYGSICRKNYGQWSLQRLSLHVNEFIFHISQLHQCACHGMCRAKKIGLYCLRETCRIYYKKMERLFNSFLPNKESIGKGVDSLLPALYIINFQSLAETDRMKYYLIRERLGNIVAVIAEMLKPCNWHVLQALSAKNTTTFYQEKKGIFEDILMESIGGYRGESSISRLWNNTVPLKESVSCGSFFKRRVPNYNTSPLVTDGVVYDRQRDPPGQRSVYIPPGDHFRESYRLSTFIKYPTDIPVNPRQLAASGFYYTGYKDRVKCFSCGLCVEQWQTGDDVKSVRWHRNDCKFMKNLDSGNVPVGGGGLARFLNPSTHFNTGAANLTSSPVQASHTSQASQFSSATPQTARPQRQSASIFNIVEFATIPSSYHEHFLKNLDLRKESERIRTFEHWPSERPTVSPNDLARSGFFYLGNLDRVQCFSCAGVLRNWNYGDVVNNEHRRHFPHCRLVQGAEDRNVPLSPEEQAVIPRQQIVFQEPPDPSENEQRDLENMFRCQFPVNPHMRNENGRFETFDQRWSANNVNATPRQIARAGFFYLGERDRVKCWYCNGGLQNWDREDEPWTEHAKWFPTCEFLLQRKGPDFVHRMVSMFPNLPRPIMGGQYDVPPREIRPQFGRARSPPPQIIDPQEEIRQEDARIIEAMRSDLVQVAYDLGFERNAVRRLVARRVRDSGMYSNVEDLVADLTDLESSQQPEDSDEDITDEPQSSAGPSSAPSQSMEEETSTSMQARIQELQDERKCKICHNRLADIVFVPCGHLCCCSNCSPDVRRCPMCKKKVKEAIRTYMS